MAVLQHKPCPSTVARKRPVGEERPAWSEATPVSRWRATNGKKPTLLPSSKSTVNYISAIKFHKTSLHERLTAKAYNNVHTNKCVLHPFYFYKYITSNRQHYITSDYSLHFTDNLLDEMKNH